MRINIIALGNKMPDWIEEGYQEYARRLRQAGIELNLEEIPLQKRRDKQQISTAIAKENEQILGKLAKTSYRIALDEHGKEYSSKDLARRFLFWQGRSQNLAIVVGAPEGLSAQVRAAVDEFWSLSRLTLPHPLVRVVLAEALYRAWSINKNHPYHRE